MRSATVLIALGSNLGDRRARLDGAIEALGRTPGVEVRAVSRSHETSPVGGPSGQGPFLNAAARLETVLEPTDLHARLVELEREAGRRRRERWGERTLDLDLILFGDRVIETAGLVVPHPRFAVRRFVLAPLAEVASGAVDPRTGLTVASLLDRLDRRRVVFLGFGSEWRAELGQVLPAGWAVTEDASLASFGVVSGDGGVETPWGLPVIGLGADLDEARAELRASCEAAE